MASMQCYKTTNQTYNPVDYPPGQTQCYSQSQTYYTDHGLGKTQITECYTTQTPTSVGYGSGYGSGIAMGSTHGTPGYGHSPSHYMDQNKVHGHGHHGHGYGHGLTHTNNSNGYGLGLNSTDRMSHTTYGSNGMPYYGKAKKQGLHYNKNTDGHCSDSCSDSESDDERCGRRMMHRY